MSNKMIGPSGGLVVKNPPANAGDTGLFPGPRATIKPAHHNIWACALELVSHNYWAPVNHVLKPSCLEPVLHSKRNQCNEKPMHSNEE